MSGVVFTIVCERDSYTLVQESLRGNDKLTFSNIGQQFMINYINGYNNPIKIVRFNCDSDNATMIKRLLDDNITPL